MASINFFIKESELPQQLSSLNYGPVSSTQYRVTSLFKGSTSGTEPMAFAVSGGKVFIVDQINHPTRVNLILKPTDNILGMPPVKYFIYRGLLKADFLDVNDSYKHLKPTDANDSVLIEIIRKGKETSTSDDDRMKALDLYTAIQSTTTSSAFIDNLFIKEEHQFASVNAGASLGRFDTIASNLEYGFEIILDEFWYAPTMEIARMETNVINIPTTVGDDEVARLDILCYIDPAAYFGCFSHGDFSIKTNNSTGDKSKKKDGIYDLVKKFATKNKVYLDIRGMQGHPMDWFSTDPTTIQINLDGTSALSNASPISYRDTDAFPLHIISSGFSNALTHDGQKYFKLVLSFSTINNATPLLALHIGYWQSYFPEFKKDINFSQCTDNTGWTDDKKFIVFAASDSGNDVPVATYIRMQLTEYIDATAFDDQIPGGDAYEPYVIDMKFLFPVPTDILPDYDDITNTHKPIDSTPLV